MNVPNFWYDVTLDNELIDGGPRAPDGEMHICVYQRVKGILHPQLMIDCNVLGAEKNGLQIVVTDMDTKTSTFICPSRR